MKLGFFTANFTEKPLEEVVRMIAPYGYETIEVPAYEGNGQLETADVLKGNTASQIRSMVESYGMTIQALSNHSDSFLIMGPTGKDTDFIFRVKLDIGFKCDQRINVYLRQIVQDLQESRELPAQEKKYSIYDKGTVGNFRFCVIHKAVPHRFELPAGDVRVLNIKYAIRKCLGSRTRWYGLDTTNLIEEKVPMVVSAPKNIMRIRRK